MSASSVVRQFSSSKKYACIFVTITRKMAWRYRAW
uniref:Uncharacterized protein n=1 Tax=Arundo donax TaxID=35708 RepID=A0A0A9GYH2_ARUDO